jgi:hypothetical protein
MPKLVKGETDGVESLIYSFTFFNTIASYKATEHRETKNYGLLVRRWMFFKYHWPEGFRKQLLSSFAYNSVLCINGFFLIA